MNRTIPFEFVLLVVLIVGGIAAWFILQQHDTVLPLKLEPKTFEQMQAENPLVPGEPDMLLDSKD